MPSTTSSRVLETKNPTENVSETKLFEEVDDWGDEDDEDEVKQVEEENGNFESIPKNLNLERLTLSETPDNMCSPSPDTSTSEELGTTSYVSLTEDDDNNANFENGNGQDRAPAAAAADPLIGTAEIEDDDEGQEVIAVDDEELKELQNNTRIPQFLMGGAVGGAEVNFKGIPEFKSFYLYVEEETLEKQDSTSLTDHERQLLLEYKAKEAENMRMEASNPRRGASKAEDSSGDGYEKALPKHGDLWVYKFISILQEYPGQLIR